MGNPEAESGLRREGMGRILHFHSGGVPAPRSRSFPPTPLDSLPPSTLVTYRPQFLLLQNPLQLQLQLQLSLPTLVILELLLAPWGCG